jgi:hypothetical protein
VSFRSRFRFPDTTSDDEIAQANMFLGRDHQAHGDPGGWEVDCVTA